MASTAQDAFHFSIEHICTYLTVPLSFAVNLLFVDRECRRIVQSMMPTVYVDTKEANAYIHYAYIYRWRIGSVNCDGIMCSPCTATLHRTIAMHPEALVSLIMLHDRSMPDRVLARCTRLRFLALPRNRIIGDAGLMPLRDLITIDLSHNRRITSACMQNKPHLRCVVLLHNQRVTDEAFETSRRLEYLNIGYNNNVKMTLEFVKNNPELREIQVYQKKHLQLEWFKGLKKLKRVILPKAVFV